jgi:hypothetical protein
MTNKVTFINLEEELEDRSSLISPSANTVQISRGG